MKAMIYENYGDYNQLHMADIEKPEPKEHEVLIKVHATSINMSDVFYLTGKPAMIKLDQGLSKPKKQVLCADIAGVVEAVGSNVSSFKPGDEVICDMSDDGRGGLAEYVTCDVKLVSKKPTGITMAEAATYPMAGVVAYQALQHVSIKKSDKVLIYGATGSVGIFAVQLAVAMSNDVTAVCSTKHVETIKSFGVSSVIDYTKEGIENLVDTFDLIVSVNGYQSLDTYKKCLRDGGRYVCIGGKWKQLIESLVLAPFKSNKNKRLFNMGSAKQNVAQMNVVSDMISKGLVKPYVDKTFKLEESAKAFKYAMEGHPTGKVIIEVVQ